jgi:hypothetical protein
LDAGELRGDLLPESRIVPQLLRLDALDNLLALRHELVELFTGTHVQRLETLEELAEIPD